MRSTAEQAQLYCVNERTIQRGIDDIRNFLDNKTIRSGDNVCIEYDRSNKCFHLINSTRSAMTTGQALAVCKVLLDCCAFLKNEMKDILHILIDQRADESGYKLIKELIGNEMFHYVELCNATELDEFLQTLGQAVLDNRYIRMSYLRTYDKKVVERTVMPLVIMFSKYYFYLLAFIADEAAIDISNKACQNNKSMI